MDTFDNNQKKITAKRLKELRNGRRLSHESLSKELEKNKVHISVQALKDYEVTEENHSKFSSTKGMSIEKLYGLAKFYNVSADYLLGLTDIKDADVSMQACCEYTGLSETAIKFIKCGISNPEKQCFSEIISETEFLNLLLKILELQWVTSNFFKSLSIEPTEQKNIDKIYEKKFDEADLCRYKINKEFEKVIDNFDLRTKDENKPLLDKLEKLIVQSRVLKMLKEMEQENPPTSSTDTDGEQGGL